MTIDLLPLATTQDVSERKPAVAILTIGSFEQHGPFLPLVTDTLIASIIANAIAHEYPVLHLPPITMSCSHEHKSWPGTVSISARTLCEVISDIRDSLEHAGVPKLILINGHGGNYVLRNIVQEASVHGPSIALFPGSSDWKRARTVSNMITSDHDDMHAGELETSILLHACPHLVEDGYQSEDNLADDRSDLLTLGMTAYTKTGIVGRPSLASAAKGKAAIVSLTESFAHYLTVLTNP
jgi:creatinine amidohydrolase